MKIASSRETAIKKSGKTLSKRRETTAPGSIISDGLNATWFQCFIATVILREAKSREDCVTDWLKMLLVTSLEVSTTADSRILELQSTRREIIRI